MYEIYRHKSLNLWYNLWYNMPVSRKARNWSLTTACRRQKASISGILLTTRPSDGCILVPVKTLLGRDHRVRCFGELRKRIRRPQHIRNISVLGFVAKPLTFHNEKPDTMVRRVSFTRRALFSCFSLRFLAAPATRRDFEGAPLSFPRRSGTTL